MASHSLAMRWGTQTARVIAVIVVATGMIRTQELITWTIYGRPMYYRGPCCKGALPIGKQGNPTWTSLRTRPTLNSRHGRVGGRKRRALVRTTMATFGSSSRWTRRCRWTTVTCRTLFAETSIRSRRPATTHARTPRIYSKAHS